MKELIEFGDIQILLKASAETTGGALSVFEEEELRLGPGELAFAPRGIPHSQRRVVPRTGRLLILTAPAGLEGFFRELAEAEASGTLGPDAYARASSEHGISWL